MEVTKVEAITQKSFYGKALQIDHDGIKYLKSYDTIVCAIENGDLIRLWSGYSLTTMNHINAFCIHNGLQGCNKKAWDNLEVKSIEIPIEVSNV